MNSHFLLLSSDYEWNQAITCIMTVVFLYMVDIWERQKYKLCIQTPE